jgi:hypothetical protein
MSCDHCNCPCTTCAKCGEAALATTEPPLRDLAWRVRRASEIISDHLAQEKEPPEYPGKLTCKCGLVITAIDSNSMTSAFVHHQIQEALRGAAATTETAGLRDGLARNVAPWPSQGIESFPDGGELPECPTCGQDMDESAWLKARAALERDRG